MSTIVVIAMIMMVGVGVLVVVVLVASRDHDQHHLDGFQVSSGTLCRSCLLGIFCAAKSSASGHDLAFQLPVSLSVVPAAGNCRLLAVRHEDAVAEGIPKPSAFLICLLSRCSMTRAL